MTEREALLHAICLEPEEDTPRLAYADWLDEYGDEADKANAEQIRVQIEYPAERIELHWKHSGIPGITGSVSRGFVAEIDLDTQLYLAHGADLFRHHPITTVYLTDKRPLWDVENNAQGWWTTARVPARHEAHLLPHSFRAPMMEHPLRVTPHLLRFQTYLEAMLAASEIAVNLARKLIDFPPLPLTKRLRPNDGPA